MGMNFTFQESSVLYGMLAESSTDIIFKTDPDGAIVHASPGMERLGHKASDAAGGEGLAPQRLLLDLVAPEARQQVAKAHARALAGDDVDWFEFPALAEDSRKRWFELRLRALLRADGAPYGVLGVMRSVDELRSLSERLFTATYTDALTGLTNRAAFVSMLRHMLDAGMDGCLALFSIDFFRTINMQYGQSAGDEVLTVFGDLLRELLRTDDLISRIGSERFAVILPRVTPVEAEGICRRVVTTLADLKQTVGEGTFAVTASASVARIATSLDSTMGRAEMALFVARAKGRNRLEMEKPVRLAAG
ncbi:PAS domain S-box-containing protein/diguanylate cyclase (GGDEF) domain-containing protein [Novosphingobium panipatense]|jgi:diguanylate cyclase (GGDEF)-like protein/PAS domain S-box-containing protein|uniref:PAS domain S-box-containing protein/diguanylate cyclase (GGDEF) domain-containing protein n=2 Tax=Sphingomonadaceae TaxID=41297 RepID=A0ABY1QQJ0_9SPHN|nr:PAS domain S-box-containing protein/diguanylate cyclase (GGDEF) domain-containing protein [Novosphingobium panipatense]